MQNTEIRQRALEVHERLLGVYGEPRWRPDLDPVGQLVSTILSQNTNDVNRDRAFKQLRERFPTWEAVRDAHSEAVKEAIRIAGLANHKAPAIQRALRHITEQRGNLSLDFLNLLPTSEAKSWLTAIKGVGPKTAAIVLLFALGMPAFPVDTHVHRVTRRLGLIGPKVSREKAHQVLEGLLPEKLYFAFHLNVIRHGREVCIARKPRCEVCVLADAGRRSQNAQAFANVRRTRTPSAGQQTKGPTMSVCPTERPPNLSQTGVVPRLRGRPQPLCAYYAALAAE